MSGVPRAARLSDSESGRFAEGKTENAPEGRPNMKHISLFWSRRDLRQGANGIGTGIGSPVLGAHIVHLTRCLRTLRARRARRALVRATHIANMN